MSWIGKGEASESPKWAEISQAQRQTEYHSAQQQNSSSESFEDYATKRERFDELVRRNREYPDLARTHIGMQYRFGTEDGNIVIGQIIAVDDDGYIEIRTDAGPVKIDPETITQFQYVPTV